MVLLFASRTIIIWGALVRSLQSDFCGSGRCLHFSEMSSKPRERSTNERLERQSRMMQETVAAAVLASSVVSVVHL